MRTPILLTLLSWSCQSTFLEQFESCLLEVEPAETSVPVVSPGSEITLVGGPLSTPWDSRVLVGGEPAEVLSITREGCSDCDTCRTDQECGACGTCDACTSFCTACVEQLVFVVPEVAAGTWSVLLVNRYGSSTVAVLEVAAQDAPLDSDGGDTDPTETDPGDTDPPSDTDQPDTDQPDTDPPSDTDQPDTDPPSDTAPADSASDTDPA